MKRKPQTRAATVARIIQPTTNNAPADTSIAPPDNALHDRLDAALRAAWRELRAVQRPAAAAGAAVYFLC